MPLSKIQIIKKLYNEGIFTLDDIVLKSGKKVHITVISVF